MKKPKFKIDDIIVSNGECNVWAIHRIAQVNSDSYDVVRINDNLKWRYDIGHIDTNYKKFEIVKSVLKVDDVVFHRNTETFWKIKRLDNNKSLITRLDGSNPFWVYNDMLEEKYIQITSHKVEKEEKTTTTKFAVGDTVRHYLTNLAYEIVGINKDSYDIKEPTAGYISVGKFSIIDELYAKYTNDPISYKKWSVMSRESKGAILLALQEGETIECHCGYHDSNGKMKWSPIAVNHWFQNSNCYRIKPKTPVVKKQLIWVFMDGTYKSIGSVDYVDGVIDPSTAQYA